MTKVASPRGARSGEADRTSARTAPVRKSIVRKSVTVAGKPCWTALRPGEPKAFADGYHYDSFGEAVGHATRPFPL